MLKWAKQRLYNLLRWSEKYTKTDMVYFASGNFWLMLGRIVGIGSGILLTVVFANFFSPNDFGTYKYLLATAGIIGAFSLGGLGAAVTRAIALGKQHVVPKVFRTSVLWSAPASIGALAGAVYYLWNGNIVLAVGFFLIGLTTILSGTGLYKSIMLGKKDFRNIAYSSVRSAIPVIALICAILLTQNLLIVILTYFLSNLTVSVSMYLWAIHHYRIIEKAEADDDTVSYGKHVSVMSVITQATDSVDQLLLWHFAGPIQLAIYSFAMAPIRELKNFSQNIYPLVFPKYATKTVAQMKETIPLRIWQLVIVSSGIIVLYVIGAPFLYQFLFPQYISAVFLSQVLAIGILFQAKGMVETMLYVQGNTRLRYITIVVSQVGKVLLWIILIPLYGMLGAVVGTLIADLISSLMLWWAYKKLS